MGSPNVDFGAPMSALGVISGALGVAGQLGIEIPSFSDVLSDIGFDSLGLDVTDWVSENLLNGAVLPAELLNITENLNSLIKTGSVLELANTAMDISKFSNILTPGGGIDGAINLGSLNTVADALGLKASQLIDRIQSTGIITAQGKLSDALKLGLDTLNNGIKIDQLNKVGEFLNVNISKLGLPDIDTILKGSGISLSADKLAELESAISRETVGSANIIDIVTRSTGATKVQAKNLVVQITGITLPYIQSKVNTYLENNSGSAKNLVAATTTKVMNTIKTKITLDIQAETGGVIFL
jgi:hypothetical protein